MLQIVAFLTEFVEKKNNFTYTKVIPYIQIMLYKGIKVKSLTDKGTEQIWLLTEASNVNKDF